MLIDFVSSTRKLISEEPEEEKPLHLARAEADIDENIVLTGQQRAARCRSTVQLTEIYRQTVAKGYAKESWPTASQKRSRSKIKMLVLLLSTMGKIVNGGLVGCRRRQS